MSSMGVSQNEVSIPLQAGEDGTGGGAGHSQHRPRPPPFMSMKERWKEGDASQQTAIWIPDSSVSHRKLIRKWNRLSRLQRSLIYAAVLISLTLIGLLCSDRFLSSKANKSALNNNIEIESANETLVIESAEDDAKKLKASLIGNESDERPLFTGPSNQRQKAVVESFQHAWKGYKEYAWGHDNLKPLSKAASDWFSLGLTLVDGLDTAYIMGLTKEFEEGRDWVENVLTFTANKDVNLFEVTIRVLGALLSNYHFTQESVFIRKARDLGDRLMGAFTSPSGIPFSDVNLSSKRAHAPDWSPYSSTAEVTTIQLEFRELSRATGDPKYEEAAALVSAKIHQLPKKHGLVPIFISPHTGNFLPHATVTLGARGDSYYEYLLKQWLQTGKTIDYLKEDYLTAMEGVRELLAKRTSPNKLLFIGELSSGSEAFNPKMDHLTCFLPGTLALGYSHGLPRWHLSMAEELLYTCYMTYAVQPTFLAPEITHFNMDMDVWKTLRYTLVRYGIMDANPTDDMYTKSADAHSLLRPEFVESLWYMYQITGNTTFQDWGWQIFEAFQKYARVDGGFVSLSNVRSVKPPQRDMMESFFLSETLKYLYLLFSDDRYLIDLEKFVINSEAHPLPMRDR